MLFVKVVQPWASLIAENVLQFEQKNWSEKYRGEVLITASPTWTERQDRDRERVIEFLADYLGDRSQVPSYLIGEMPLGVALGMSSIRACYHRPRHMPDMDDLQYELCAMRRGHHLWKLDEVRPFPRPIKRVFKGDIGRVDSEMLAIIRWGRFDSPKLIVDEGP